MSIQEIWFVLLGLMLAGYAVLDGFDLGVGILHPLSRTDHDRRLFLNSIGPIWDGNEVWLIVFGGALFAAFPDAYASAFSGFYLAFIMLLLALIFRAVSIEFRSKSQSTLWRTFWDYGFFFSSAGASFVYGLAAGNSLLGIPLNGKGEYIGGFRNLLSPYSILAGLIVVSMFAMHGTIFLFLKLPEGDARKFIRRCMWRSWIVFIILYAIGTAFTLKDIPRATANFENYPWAVIGVVTSVLGILNIGRAIHHEKPFQAFASSTVTIVSIVFLFCVSLFPNLVVANNDGRSLTVVNASSSEKTLWMMFAIAMVGMPFVLTYTAIVYWTFRGRVRIEEHSY